MALTEPKLQISNFSLRLLAEKLTLKHAAADAAKLNSSLGAAIVDLNPHQIEASVFAFNSPLARGAILADEVGLGKTIEAGLIVSQLVSEGKNRILVLVPASLRGQWQAELLNKFGLDALILEGPNFRKINLAGRLNPFDQKCIVISSIPFAYKKAAEIKSLNWDLAVIDEAHRLRNVYKTGNKQARALKEILAGQPKLLLTATPIQNNLLELFGIVSFVDEKLLGTEYSFRANFIQDNRGLRASNLDELKRRTSGIITRTLRRQVKEYIQFTDRKSMVQDFTPTAEELELYERVSAYLQRPNVAAIEHSQRTLMILVYRKLLASSSFAICNTLYQLIKNLETKLASQEAKSGMSADTDEALETFAEEAEELVDASSDTNEVAETPAEQRRHKQFSIEDIQQEIAELKTYYDLARRISRNAKGDALKIALNNIFAVARDKGWPEKAVIFTESRRTQRYLKEQVLANYAITEFSGASGDIKKRQALLDEFRRRTQILLTTEAGAEGLNLQFCNIIVNYDLPWNPQRIEQRIGRCHRYGQNLDVMVINFLNRANAADRHLYFLLDEKLALFNGIFGASDEVLGALDSGIDFERRVLDIYQSCRTEAEIDAAFQRLRDALGEEIAARLAETRAALFENFDDEVKARLRLRDQKIKAQLSSLELHIKRLIEGCFGDRIRTLGDHVYEIELPADVQLRTGLTSPIKISFSPVTVDEAQSGIERIHLNHPLVKDMLAEIKGRELNEIPRLRLLYTGNHRITKLERHLNTTGYWFAFKLAFDGLEIEERLVPVVLDDNGGKLKSLSPDIAHFFEEITAEENGTAQVPSEARALADEAIAVVEAQLLETIQARNEEYFELEADKLDTYAEESLQQGQDTLEKIKRQWNQAKKKRGKAETADERNRLRAEIDKLEAEYRRQLMKNNEASLAQIDEKKKVLNQLEAKLKVKVDRALLAVAAWELL